MPEVMSVRCTGCNSVWNVAVRPEREAEWHYLEGKDTCPKDCSNWTEVVIVVEAY